jgi:hypothetical protein
MVEAILFHLAAIFEGLLCASNYALKVGKQSKNERKENMQALGKKNDICFLT